LPIEDETEITRLAVWPQMLQRFRRTALGATLLTLHRQMQREEGVVYIAKRLDGMTPRLNTVRDHTGEQYRPGGKPPLASPANPLGQDARDIIIASRDFR
jgi:hypothetical protein